MLTLRFFILIQTDTVIIDLTAKLIQLLVSWTGSVWAWHWKTTISINMRDGCAQIVHIGLEPTFVQKSFPLLLSYFMHRWNHLIIIVGNFILKLTSIVLWTLVCCRPFALWFWYYLSHFTWTASFFALRRRKWSCSVNNFLDVLL